MDEEVSIIDSNTRNEKVRNFFINNKKKIISMVIILLIVLVGAYSFDSYKNNKHKEIILRWERIINLISITSR